MSVKKNEAISEMPESMAQKSGCGCGHLGMMKHPHVCGYGKLIILTLFAILLAYVIVWFGTLSRNNMKKYFYIGQSDRMERTITVDGKGEVKAIPDVAQTNVGFTNKAKTVEEAQLKNTTVMNKLTEELKKLKIDKKDIETVSYYVYPNYVPAGENKPYVLDGYEVSQSMSIKIRDLNITGQVLALVGTSGATNVSGLEFIIDDPEVYKDQARQEAIAEASAKAKVLAKRLGVHLVSVMSYNEGNNDYYSANYGLGGMMKSSSAAELAPVPQVEPGSQDVTVNVNITYEIR